MNKQRAFLPLMIIATVLTFSGCSKSNGKADDTSTAASETTASQSVTAVQVQNEEAQADDAVSETSSEPEDNESEKSTAKMLLEGMTLEQKIGQMFIVTPEALSSTTGAVKKYDESIGQKLEKYPVGGIIYFANNISDPKQITELNKQLQEKSAIPLFITTDEEGGDVTRIAKNASFGITQFDDMFLIGNTAKTENAFNVGKTIGAYLKDYGFNIDLAPDADVYTNPANTVIGRRAFSSDPNTAAQMVSACVDGFHESGMICTLKHFPGHGDTSADSHYGYVAVYKSWGELKECELKPFEGSIDKTDMIMASHVTLPNITADGLPASLSHEILTEKLRNELGFKGVIITDSMSMKAISAAYSPSEAVILAINAGDDILLMPASLSKAFDGVKQAVQNGELSEERIDQSVRRIIELKIKYGIIKEG